jgi:hypothetical protein
MVQNKSLNFLPGEFLDQPNNLTRFSVTPGLKFGEYQLPVYAYFVTASVGRKKSHTLDLRFKILEQIICQAHGLVCIVSNSAIDDLDYHHDAISFMNCPKIILLLT